MPAPETPQHTPVMGHVNLMVDTFIANANIEDLRAICRSLLASGTPGIANLFTVVARSRVRQTSSKALIRRPLFVKNSPTSNLIDTLRRARTIYGCGLGFSSLPILTEVIRATIGLRWEQEGDMVKALADIDIDITQAIQSCKEELDCGRVEDYLAARDTVYKLRAAIEDSHADVESWFGEFPFGRAKSSIEYWKL